MLDASKHWIFFSWMYARAVRRLMLPKSVCAFLKAFRARPLVVDLAEDDFRRPATWACTSVLSNSCSRSAAC